MTYNSSHYSQREKQSSKNELMRIDVCHIKSEIFSSEQFFIKLEAFKASDALTAECRSACDIYWATDRIIESMRSTMQQISTKMTNFDVYICSLQDSKKANNAILTKIAVLEGDIAAQRSKKKLLEVDICESKNKIRLYEDRLAICCQKRVDISTRLAGILNSKNLNCPSSEFESFTDSLRSQFIGIEGMLLRLGSPISNEYCTAILTVLGVKAFRTVVVRSRECAVLVADKMNIMKLNWSSIIICDELVGKQQESMRHSSHHQLIPLVSVMNFPSDVAKVVFESKLLKWMLFTGNANESIKISELFKGINVVCLDGCQFLADGEIKLSFGTSLNSFENTDCKNENMHGWILGASTYSHEKQIELEHDLASMCDDIDNIESHILSTSISLKIMENDYRDIENTINKKDRNINELRFAITTDPISPDINIAECTKELEHYTEMENDRSQQRCLIENLVKNQVFENMDVMEIIANANAHQRTIHMGRSKLRSRVPYN